MGPALSGSRAMVVGAEFETGGAIALALAEGGANVAVCALQPDESALRSRKVKRAIEALGRSSSEYVMDVMLGRNVQVTTRQVAKEMSGLDFVISAGELMLEAPLSKITETELARVVAFNFSAHLFIIRSAAGEFARNELVEGQRGSVLIVTKHAASRVKIAAVAGAQAGAQQLVREASRELAEIAVCVNALIVHEETDSETVGIAARDLIASGVTGEVAEVS